MGSWKLHTGPSLLHLLRPHYNNSRSLRIELKPLNPIPPPQDHTTPDSVYPTKRPKIMRLNETHTATTHRPTGRMHKQQSSLTKLTHLKRTSSRAKRLHSLYERWSNTDSHDGATQRRATAQGRHTETLNSCAETH